ncbi:hypothetical protein, conserved [Leishmania tarentolae]|uniref:Uncharacterized protein n=1 Tax=Leishmania tarentolae TaxID=5689 RepID=A0A640KTU7_LEITA|nr:hypothetical protein, conserved [Leishmania tarentolae]
MRRFFTSLCLNGVRTSDNVPLHVVDAQTLSLNGKLVAADDVVELALPSKLATAMMSSMAAAPTYAYSMFLLLGSQVHHGRLGDAVIHSIIRKQVRHRLILDERPISWWPVAATSEGRNGTNEAPLQYEECLLFAYDGAATACETLRATDAAETVDEVLRSLRVISLAVFKYKENKTCAVLVGSHLSTAHMASLLLASNRHVFLYIDETMSAEEMLATTAEMQQVRESLFSFAAPLAVDLERARRTVGSSGGGALPIHMSCTLNALAHTDGEYKVLLAALSRELAEQHSTRRLHGAATAPGDTEAGSVPLPETLQRELDEARAAQRAAEDALADQRRAHRKEVMLLRAELEDAQRNGEDTVVSEMLHGSTVNGRAVAKTSLQSLQQPQHGHRHHSSDAESNTIVSQLHKALQDARKAQQFAEEKARLLELRQSLTSGNRDAPTVAGDPSGAVTSPRPSLRLPPPGMTSTTAPIPSATAPPAWEQNLLKQENAALVAEFQRKESAWQQQLLRASTELAQLRQERATMEATLQLQSQAIATAQKTLVDNRAAQELEMKQLLERVRVLSQESRSRLPSQTQRAGTDQTHGSPAGGAMPEAGAVSPSLYLSGSLQRHDTPEPFLTLSPAPKTAPSIGGIMSPNR